jgi:hypothetical protein
MSLEERVFNACNVGDLDTLSGLLAENPDFDLSTRYGESLTLLHGACEPCLEHIIEYLLSLQGIDVNARDVTGLTPFSLCCLLDRPRSARLFLQDNRVDVLVKTNQDLSSVWIVTSPGSPKTLKEWIISGRPLETPGSMHMANALGNVKGIWERRGTERRATTFLFDLEEIMHILERFVCDPDEERHRLRMDCGWYRERAAGFFAHVIFVSDGLLKAKPVGAEFFSITSKLPMELQMMVCNRAAGTMRDVVATHDSDPAFKKLALAFKKKK